jgi:hypothetical protein
MHHPPFPSPLLMRLFSSNVHHRDTFLPPSWMAALSKFGSAACDEEGGNNVHLPPIHALHENNYSINFNDVEGHVLISKIVSLLLDGVHSTPLQVATAVVGYDNARLISNTASFAV